MLSALWTGMRRYTRSSRYVDRKKMRQTIRANRPGNQGFSFTGDFPEATDWLPVEATRRPRCYTRQADNGVSDVVTARVDERLPVFSRYGVRMGVAIPMLILFALLLGAIWMGAYAANAGVSQRLAQQEARAENLQQTAITLEGEIARRSSGINVRQEALRIGLKSSRGMSLTYVDVPDAAVVDPATYGLRQDVASVFGQ